MFFVVLMVLDDSLGIFFFFASFLFLVATEPFHPPNRKLSRIYRLDALLWGLLLLSFLLLFLANNPFVLVPELRCRKYSLDIFG